MQVEPLIIEQLNATKNNENIGIDSPFSELDLNIQTRQSHGLIIFENYEQLKEDISNGVAYYSKFQYSLSNYQIALKHHSELKHIKNILEKTKKEIINNHNAPLVLLQSNLDELINLIKIPYKKVDSFIKQNEKNRKKYAIYLYARSAAIAHGLQEHIEYIWKSPAFFDQKWLYASCSRATWEKAILSKIISAANDINQIISMNHENTTSILNYYYQTLSMKNIEEFINSLKITSSVINNTTININNNNSEINKDSLNSKVSKNDTIYISEDILDNKFLQDSEILNSVANSINPYTGEIITGIDSSLKKKLLNIATHINFFSIFSSNNLDKNFNSQILEECYSTINYNGFDVFIDENNNIITDTKLLSDFKELRKQIALQQGVPLYIIATNKMLVLLATLKPKTREDFLQIKGIADIWYLNYANQFIEEMEKHNIQ